MARAIAAFDECALERAEAAVGAEVPDFAPHADGDVEGLPLEARPLPVRNAAALLTALPAGAAAFSSPGG
jgi:hypothetical protein